MGDWLERRTVTDGFNHFPLKERYGRKDAVGYLQVAHGITRTYTTLEKLACVGGGPKFFKAGRRQVIYLREDLDAWARELLGEAVGSTSERKSPGRKDRGE